MGNILTVEEGLDLRLWYKSVMKRKLCVFCLAALLVIVLLGCAGKQEDMKETVPDVVTENVSSPEGTETDILETETPETESTETDTVETEEETLETENSETEATVSASKSEAETKNEKAFTPWKITQYGPLDAQMSYYTIYNKDAGLILVDGGWADCADHVRNTIKTFGGHVDAWIITHPHADHVGAFSSIYPNLDGITISNIYTVDMATPEECLKVASWDDMSSYEEFLTLEVEGLQYLYPGDVLDISGLKLEILSAYDENVQNLSEDYLNDGSLMFKVYGEEESFLFCADVGISMSDYLLTKFGEEKLASTYLQMGHHGFGGLADNFYQAVKPKVAFFDAPDWLMKDETGKYDTPENVALMESLGSRIYGFSSAPNSIILK